MIKALVIITGVDVNVAAGGMRALTTIMLTDGTQRVDNEPAPYADINAVSILAINNGLKNWAKQWTIDHWGTTYVPVVDEVRLLNGVDLL